MIPSLLQLGAVYYVVALLPQGTTAPPVVIGTVAESAIMCNLDPPSTPVAHVIGPTLTVWWNDAARAGKKCATPAVMVRPGAVPLCRAAPCPTYIAMAGPVTAQSVTTEPVPLGAECTPPLGNRAVAVFPTNLQHTTGLPGSRSRLNYQLASPNSPITDLLVKIDGGVVAELHGATLNDSAGLWMTLPASGTYAVTIQAINAHGCSNERPAADLTVP